MILSRPEIIKYLESNALRFDPQVSEDRVKQVSIDLLLGRQFTTFKDPPDYLHTVKIDPSIGSSKDLCEHRVGDEFTLHPGEFVLAQTLESVHIPGSLMGFVEGRSSYARFGLTVHLSAPKIDPGFTGHIALEMANFGKLPVTLRAGIDSPAQLILAQISPSLDPSEQYGAQPTDIYQNQQSPLPQPKQTKS